MAGDVRIPQLWEYHYELYVPFNHFAMPLGGHRADTTRAWDRAVVVERLNVIQCYSVQQLVVSPGDVHCHNLFLIETANNRLFKIRCQGLIKC